VTGNGFLEIDATSALYITTVSPSDTLVTLNHFENCSNWAIHVVDTGTSAHHNYFVDCNLDDSGEPVGPQVYTGYEENEWDDGTEGNYWSDYLYQNPSATNDGVTWNSPYVIRDRATTQVQDDHPLVEFKDTVPPIAFVGSDMTVAAGTSFELDGSGSIDNVGISSYRWTIGTVEKSGMKTSHTFDTLGEVPVSLRVEDAAGLWDEVTITARVVDGIPPVANAGDDITVEQATIVWFNGTNSTDNIGIKSFLWTFEYGGSIITRTRMVSSFRFDSPGEYLVTLTVTDRQGNTANDTMFVRVLDTQPPRADAGPDIEIDEGGEVVLDATNSTDNDRIVEYSWNITVGSQTYSWLGPIASYIIPQAGYYEATLRVTDAYGNWDEDKVFINVLDKVPPVADAGDDRSVGQGVIVIFDSSGSDDNVGIRNWLWEFHVGDEYIQLDGPAPSYIFHEVGTYVVTLVVLDQAGFWDEDDMTVTVLDTTDPVPSIGVEFVFDQGETIELDGTFSSDNVGIVRWTWAITHPMGNGTASGVRTTYLFEHAGYYNVTLRVEDARGNADTKLVVVQARDTEFPVAVPLSDPLRTKVKVMTELDGSPSHDNMGVVKWSWTIQYAKRTYELEGEVAEFKFKEPGRGTITLIVEDAAGLQDSMSFKVIVEAEEGSDDSGFSAMAIGAIAVVVVVAAILASLLWMKRRETPPKSPDGP
jgi:PKD repeat protein